jgi:hypothetical protein
MCASNFNVLTKIVQFLSSRIEAACLDHSTSLLHVLLLLLLLSLLYCFLAFKPHILSYMKASFMKLSRKFNEENSRSDSQSVLAFRHKLLTILFPKAINI